MSKKQRNFKKKFTRSEVKHLLSDLHLYSGNIKEITNLETSDQGHISGLIRTCVDSFRFFAIPMTCGGNNWCIHLPDNIECLRHGNGPLAVFTFPKIHCNPALEQRYKIANSLYDRYANCRPISESIRLPHLEQMLGYEKHPTAWSIVEAIIKDFRSHQQQQDVASAKLLARN